MTGVEPVHVPPIKPPHLTGYDALTIPLDSAIHRSTAILLASGLVVLALPRRRAVA